MLTQNNIQVILMCASNMMLHSQYNELKGSDKISFAGLSNQLAVAERSKNND